MIKIFYCKGSEQQNKIKQFSLYFVIFLLFVFETNNQKFQCFRFINKIKRLYIMKKEEGLKAQHIESPNKLFQLQKYLNLQFINKKTTCVPLEFQYLPVEILSKEYTKLNNPHPYRIHYLGPRFKNTIQLHKKSAYLEKRPYVYNSDVLGFQSINTNKTGNGQKESNFGPLSQNNIALSEAQEALQRDTQINNLVTVSEGDLKDYTHVCHEMREQLVERYHVDMKKIAHSFLLEQKLKNTQYFKSTVYYRAFEGMNPSLDVKEQFVFQSGFQGGNLDCVIKIDERQFDLFLRIDSNTRGHLLWFYFSVKNQDKLGKIRMNICNFSKSKTLYKNGLKPYVFSQEKFKTQKKDWEQQAENMGQQKRSLRYDILQNKVNTNNVNCLVLEYDFEYVNDEVFFAYCIPYTYSQLLYDIKRLPEKYVQKTVLGKSLMGVNIPLLHITQNPDEPNEKQGKTKSQNQSTSRNIQSQKQIKSINSELTQRKKVILVTGRIHPSEANSSYVIMGFINWLCSEEKEAVQLRKIARFLIVPMVNPDGVIIGNSRTSASGKDLNRQYINPDPFLNPQIFLIKQFAKKIHSQNEIKLFLDFHGHSRKKNTFFYGPVYNISEPNYYKSRILPKLIEKISNPFRYHSCSFNIIEDKKRTARASMFQNLGIEFTYTVQSSIGYFYDSEKMKIFEFSQQQWRKMGGSIAKGTALFMTGMQSYEQILSERRRLRLRKKKFYRFPNVKLQYLEDEMFLNLQNEEQPLKIPYYDKDKQSSLSPKHRGENKSKNVFMELLQELRTNTTKMQKAQIEKNGQIGEVDIIKDLDADEDSDSHDERQDMEMMKLNQFKSLVRNETNNYQNAKKQKHSYEIKLNIQDKNPLNLQGSSKNPSKIMNEFELLMDLQKVRSSKLRNIKTGDDRRRNFSPQKIEIHLIQEKKQMTLPDQKQEKTQKPEKIEPKFVNLIPNSNFIDTKRPIHSSAKRQRKDTETTLKRQKTIGNYFGEYQLFINQASNSNQRKRQKADIIRKLQSRRENNRKKRAESSNQIKTNTSLINSNTLNTYTSVKNNEKIHGQIIHAPTQFTFALPFYQAVSQISKSFILKPKMKPHVRQKPVSIKNFDNSFGKKEDNEMNFKEKSSKMIQGLFNLQQKQSARQTKVSQSYLIQQGCRNLGKRNYQSQKNTARESNKCTKINLNDVNNVELINSLKIHHV